MANFDDHIPTFNDLHFDHLNEGRGFRAHYTFPNGYSISVVAGQYYYSEPRLDLQSAQDYISYEMAVLDPEGEFATKEFSLGTAFTDDVVGWMNRDEISDLMTRIFLKDKLDKTKFI